MISRLYRTPPAALLACLPALLFAMAPAAREVVPAPANGGPGATIYRPDNEPLGTPGTVPIFRGDLDLEAAFETPAAVKDFEPDTVGGDDVLVAQNDYARHVSMDIAANGDIYIAVERLSGGGYPGAGILVYRSTDAGMTFQLWGTIQGSVSGYDYIYPQLQVVEGDVSGCFLAVAASTPDTGGRWQIWLAWSPLGGSAASFSDPVVVMADPGIDFVRPRFDTDVSSYADFYVYVVAQGQEVSGATGHDIWFARSTNQGASFESPYMLATLAVAGRNYWLPDIAYGYGGRLHASWHFSSEDGSFDASVRYRRASNWANSGLSSWDNWVTMTPTNDGWDDVTTRIEAGRASNQVVLAYRRWDVSHPSIANTTVRVSSDAGSSWTATGQIAVASWNWGQIIEDADTGIWYLMGTSGGYRPLLYTANAADLTSWSYAGNFADVDYPLGYYCAPDLALNPAKGNRPAVAWNVQGASPSSVFFDAAWRSDPGYPNLEPGFPLGLWAPPRSAPALVDLDGDGDLEIVFADGLNKIQVINHDGSSPAGWPVEVGATLSSGPVAVGDLAGDGQMTLVVGTADGRAFAYDRNGALLPGWPTALPGSSQPVYVSIGALGGPFPRTVVACSGNLVHFRSHHGTPPPDAPFWNTGVAFAFTEPAAIGDIDDDGIAEVVCGFGPYVAAMEMRGAAYELHLNLGNNLADAVTLGDLDLDGDLEIVCPTINGLLCVHHHDGSAVAGFPFDTGTTYNLTSAAIAQCLGTGEPEVAFGRQDWTVHLLWYDGVQANGYPRQTGTGWWLYGAPIIGRVDGTSADVIVGARDKQCWAWDNFGSLIEGWPMAAGGNVHVSPAMGDLDNDGSVEVVFVADTQLLVMDINNTETDPTRTWPMYGHDPRRTGCSDCPEDVVTAVDDGDNEGGEAITRVRFAPPTPNPVHGATTFAFAVPVRAAVSLDIYDLRGARVCTVYREETEPGNRSIAWHGRDARGEPLASGHYLARLRVRGPGVDELLTRKVTILR